MVVSRRRISHSFSRARLLALTAIAILVLASPAWGDGDPASDVLASQPAFVAQDAAITVGQQAQLGALLAAAHGAGVPMRIALVASATDLGSVTALWRQPQNYASFLGQELASVYRGPLVVVMPNGYGSYHLTSAAQRAALERLPAPGPALGAAALTAVQRLATASGHPLTVPAAVAGGRSGSADPWSWLVFAGGAVLIALAWVASLRARPIGLPGRRASTS